MFPKDILLLELEDISRLHLPIPPNTSNAKEKTYLKIIRSDWECIKHARTSDEVQYK